MSQEDWTEAHVDMLRKWHAAGVAYSEIARQINNSTGSAFSRNACIGKARRLGLAIKRARRSPNSDVTAHRERQPRQKPRQSQPRPQRKDNRVRLPDGSVPPDMDAINEIEMRKPPPEFLGIPFLELERAHCRYPHGGSDGKPMLFCGQPKIEGSSYCGPCHALCYGGGRGSYNISDAERARRAKAARQMWQRRTRAA